MYAEKKYKTIIDSTAISNIWQREYDAIWTGLTTKAELNKFKPQNIDRVIFNPPATIVIFKDGTKSVVKCGEGEKFDPEVGFAMVMMKEMFGSRSGFKKFVKKFIKEEGI